MKPKNKIAFVLNNFTEDEVAGPDGERSYNELITDVMVPKIENLFTEFLLSELRELRGAYWDDVNLEYRTSLGVVDDSLIARIKDLEKQREADNG